MSHSQTAGCEDLFDSVVQSIFGIGLQLEHCLDSTEDEATRARLDDSIRGLHDIIGRVRNRGELHCGTPCSC